jgi:hypothetical protein
MASLVSRIPLARWIALTLEPWREASAESVSPFFTTTRVLRGFAATVFDLVVVFAAVADVLGLAAVDDVTAVVRGLVLLVDDVEGLSRVTSAARVEVVVVTGVMLLGGLSFAANNDTSSASGAASFENVRLFHLEGVSAHAST